MTIYPVRTPEHTMAYAYSCSEHRYHVVRSSKQSAAMAERLHLNVAHSGKTPITEVR